METLRSCAACNILDKLRRKLKPLELSYVPFAIVHEAHSIYHERRSGYYCDVRVRS